MLTIAIPIHGDRVMPRFGCTREVVVATVDDGAVLAARRLTAATDDLQSLLEAEQVSVVICGGIHPRFQQLLQAHNIEVVWGAVGAWSEVLQAYLNGTLQSNRNLCMRHAPNPGCRFQARRHGRNS